MCLVGVWQRNFEPVVYVYTQNLHLTVYSAGTATSLLGTSNVQSVNRKAYRVQKVDCIMYSFKYDQQDATLYNILITVNALHVSGGFSAHHQELKNCTHSIEYVPAVAASKPGTYSMLCLQFLSS